MQRCFQPAQNGRKRSPQSLVGAVLVHEGVIIGEGVYARPAGPHAK